ncbi:MAG: class I tRNA ligase family protein, partial [Nevskiales bacterium]
RFHCVYWPAFLMAAELPLPRSIIAHGWLLFEESKMSKSRGNIVRTETVLDVLGADALRYFLMREVVFGQDGTFSLDALAARFNADLANDYGNLASRTLSMITRYFRGEVPYPSASAARTAGDKAIADTATDVIASYRTLFGDYQFSKALEAAWSLIAAVNKYLVENEPWAAAEKPDEESRSRLATILYTAAESLRIVTALLHPVMPDSTARIWSQLGLGAITKVRLDQLKWGQLKHATKLGKVEPVFPRTDKSALERMQQLEAERGTPSPEKEKKEAPGGASQPPSALAATPAPAATPSATSSDGRISIEDFAKVEMRVGLVKVAEKVKGADKLLRLEVDIGTEIRQVVAGIAEAYD